MESTFGCSPAWAAESVTDSGKVAEHTNPIVVCESRMYRNRIKREREREGEEDIER